MNILERQDTNSSSQQQQQQQKKGTDEKSIETTAASNCAAFLLDNYFTAAGSIFLCYRLNFQLFVLPRGGVAFDRKFDATAAGVKMSMEFEVFGLKLQFCLIKLI